MLHVYACSTSYCPLNFENLSLDSSNQSRVFFNHLVSNSIQKVRFLFQESFAECIFSIVQTNLCSSTETMDNEKVNIDSPTGDQNLENKSAEMPKISTSRGSSSSSLSSNFMLSSGECTVVSVNQLSNKIEDVTLSNLANLETIDTPTDTPDEKLTKTNIVDQNVAESVEVADQNTDETFDDEIPGPILLMLNELYATKKIYDEILEESKKTDYTFLSEKFNQEFEDDSVYVSKILKKSIQSIRNESLLARPEVELFRHKLAFTEERIGNITEHSKRLLKKYKLKDFI